MCEKILEIKNLSHRYRVQWAVKDISFDISRPGVYGLLGANGAGKSTIMNIMCGILKPTQGTVKIMGEDVAINPIVAKKNIGFLPQQPPILKDLTVEEYLKLAAGIRLMPESEIQVAVDEVLERCRITHFRGRLIKNLSGGYQQRIGIAQAIIHKPPFVVFDEPTNGLDPNQIIEIRHLIKEIAQTQTVILSTHILPEVNALCDYIWMINQGEMIFSGTMNDFDSYAKPSSIIVSFVLAPDSDFLRRQEGVLSVETLDENRVRIYYSDYQEAVNSMLKLGVSGGYTVKEVYSEKSSLEDIFATLITKSKK